MSESPKNISWSKQPPSWRVVFSTERHRWHVDRRFSLKTYGGSEKALAAAKIVRDAIITWDATENTLPPPSNVILRYIETKDLPVEQPCRECGIFSASPDVTADVADANPIYRVVPTDIGDTILDCREDEEEYGNV